MKEIIDLLTKKNKTISTMESCTGGCLANAITNIEGSSNVFKFGAVTYSNEYKIKMGIDNKLIEKYSVYSIEVAQNMSKVISDYTNSDYGIGITGKINKSDPNNKFGKDNAIFVSIYDKDKNQYYDIKINAINDDRSNNKNMIVNSIVNKLRNII